MGRKTANLVMILAFKSRQNICVDTHVHRISNRLGWVRTTTPDETEQALYRATDQRWWPFINLYLVTWGQNVCRPLSPRCGRCVNCGRVPTDRRPLNPAEAGHHDSCLKGYIEMEAGGRMKRVIGIALIAAIAVGVGLGAQALGPAAVRQSALPVVVFETSKGNFEMELYPNEAPKSVEHILTLVRRNFYNGQRVHRFVEGFVVQFGDPQSRDMTKQRSLGREAEAAADWRRGNQPEASAQARCRGAGAQR